MKFNLRIKDLRERRKLTQEEIAEKIGVTKESVSNWERNVARPNIDLIVPLCEILKTTPNYLFGFETEPVQSSGPCKECELKDKRIQYLEDAIAQKDTVFHQMKDMHEMLKTVIAEIKKSNS